MSMKYDLSILIPALKEEFLTDTIDNIIANKRGNTEVIVGLDGKWAEKGIPDHPDVRIVHVSKNRGQRGMTNLLARLSTAKYVAKTDAHCAFSEGFDVKLMDAMEGHDDWTIVPSMKNLHAFDWICQNCGMRYYQGPEPTECRSETCFGVPTAFKKKIVFLPREQGPEGRGPTSSAYRFTPEQLQFKYFGALRNAQLQSGEELVETMSLQGSFFMLTREKYWKLNICDESWGGWGQQGTEVALKTWLSGGRVVCHLGTWYAHMFRTQDGFSFPWNGNGISQGSQQRQARRASVDLFKQNKWDKQVRPLSWLIERFWEPLQQEPDTPENPNWRQKDLDEIKQYDSNVKGYATKGIIYYTDNQLNVKLARKVQTTIRNANLPIVSASLKPMNNMGTNVVVDGKRGYETMFRQILAALEASSADIVFFCEHDVLYHSSHFDFTPPEKDKFYYNHNVWRVRSDGKAVTWDADQVAELCCYREHAIAWYKDKLAQAEFNRSYEPGVRGENGNWRSEFPNVDVRHGDNLTKSKWSQDDFRDKSTCINWDETTVDKIKGWTGLSDIIGG